jgi:hypothetical protein
LAPFFAEGTATSSASVLSNAPAGQTSNLDSGYFPSNGYGLQETWMLYNNQIQPVYVRPTINLQTQGGGILYQYTETAYVKGNTTSYFNNTAVPGGTAINMTFSTTGAQSGFNNVQAAPPDTGVNQFGVVTDQLQQKWKVPVPDNLNNAPAPSTRTNDLSIPNFVGGPHTAYGSMAYYGDESAGAHVTAYNSMSLTPSISEEGIAISGNANPGTSVDTSLSASASNWAWNANNPYSMAGVPQQITVSPQFTLQPVAVTRWANMKVNGEACQFDGQSAVHDNGFQAKTSQLGSGSGLNLIYPYYIHIYNVFAIMRVIITLWTISLNSITFASGGQPINGSALQDFQINGMMTDPNANAIKQTASSAVPNGTDWTNIIILVAIAIIILVALVFTMAIVLKRFGNQGGGGTRRSDVRINIGGHQS